MKNNTLEVSTPANTCICIYVYVYTYIYVYGYKSMRVCIYIYISSLGQRVFILASPFDVAKWGKK